MATIISKLPNVLKITITASIILFISGISLIVHDFFEKKKSRAQYELMMQNQIPKVMRAVIANGAGGSEILSIKDDVPVPTADASKNEVLLKVAATAVNRADIMQRKGLYPPPPGASTILGLEASGTVVQAPASGKWKIGDQVMCLLSGGGYAQFAVAHADQCMPIPKNCPSMAHAAGVPEVFLTAYQCCRNSGFLASAEETKAASQQFKRNVLLHAGASGVATAASQIVSAFGANPVITASKDKLDDPLIKQLNPKYRFERNNVAAAAPAPPSAEGERPKSPSSQLPTWVADIENSDLGKNSIDFVIDPVVGGGYLSGDLEVLRTDGRIVILAMMGGAQIPKFDVSKLFRKRAQVIGSTLRSRDDQYKGQLVDDFTKNVFPMLFEKRDGAEYTFGPVVSKVLKIDTDVVKAHQMIENNEVIGKVIMEW